MLPRSLHLLGTTLSDTMRSCGLIHGVHPCMVNLCGFFCISLLGSPGTISYSASNPMGIRGCHSGIPRLGRIDELPPPQRGKTILCYRVEKHQSQAGTGADRPAPRVDQS